MAAVATPPPAPILDGLTNTDTTFSSDMGPHESLSNGHANGSTNSHVNGSTKATETTAPDTLPTEAKLIEVSKLPVWAADGTEHAFASLYEKQGTHMIIFIRHFLCGMCQDFLTHLSDTMPPASLPANTNITIIGCGKPELITSYAERTKCPYPIYADPTRTLYDAFGMTSNLEYGDQKPAYQTRSLAAQITRSVWQGISNLSQASKAGRPSQLGGELLIETAVEGKSAAKWCHWMKNTRGHVEVEELKKLLNVP